MRSKQIEREVKWQFSVGPFVIDGMSCFLFVNSYIYDYESDTFLMVHSRTKILKLANLFGVRRKQGKRKIVIKTPKKDWYSPWLHWLDEDGEIQKHPENFDQFLCPTSKENKFLVFINSSNTWGARLESSKKNCDSQSKSFSNVEQKPDLPMVQENEPKEILCPNFPQKEFYSSSSSHGGD
jgi:hypothetical protein